MTQQVGKYQLIRKLATGGMAEVYLAKAAGPRGFEKTLVLKRILPHLAEEPAFVEMFLSEAMLAARLTHPHIVQIFDFGEADDAYFLAMEYIDGPSLRTLVKRSVALRLPLPTTLCARVVSQACEGLAFAHDFVDPDTGRPQGLIHRDISPDNILLSRQGTAKVVDFGIAKAADQGGHRTATGVIKGKISYMPPEQLRAKDMDRRVDVYALGVVLYELLTAHKPFESTSEASLMQAILFESATPAATHRPDLPGKLLGILDRALAKNREQRYPDCHAFQADLEDFILSIGKPVTTQHVAQLIHQVTATTSGTDMPIAPMRTPGTVGSPLAGTPTHTPRPAPLEIAEAATDAERSMRAPRGASTVARPTTVQEHLPTGTTLRPAFVPEAGTPPRRSSGKWKLVVSAAALLIMGGGAILWKVGSNPKVPEPPPVASVPEPRPTPAPPRAEPSTPPSAPPETGGAPSMAAKEVQEEPRAVEPEPMKTADEPEQKTSEPAVAMRVEAEPTPKPAEPAPAPIAKPSPPEPTRRTVTPRPKSLAKGTLDLRVRPFATVYVDGVKLGDTPLSPPELTAGRHTVKLVNEEFGEKKFDIVIEPNKPSLLKVNFYE
ncbi:MAG: protein kinase [Cystobacter sp.]